MIRRLIGYVMAAERQTVVVGFSAVRGLCLEVWVSDPQSPELAVGTEVTLITYLHVRPEELSLFGFLAEEEYQTFMQLIRVSGVGPKVAIGMLGVMSPAVLVQAILHNDPKVISQAPGVGLRTARKIILELADRITDLDTLVQGIVPPADQDADMLAALTQMGFSATEASKALGQVPADVQDEGERLRLALQNLG